MHYAKALVALEEYRLTANALAMAAADNKQHLFHRIKRIMEMKTKNINYTQKLLAVLIIAVGLVSIAWLNPSGAKAESKAPAAKKALLPVSIAPAIVANPIHSSIYTTDTVPAKEQKEKAEKRDAEKREAEDINNEEAARIGMEAASKAMENIDWKQINAEVANAMKNVDWKELNKNVETAMKNIDWKEINANINANINADIKSGVMDGVDPKVMAEGMRIGMEVARKTMENFPAADIKKSMETARAALNSPEVKEAMATARKEMEKARTTMMVAQAQSQTAITNGHAAITKSAAIQNNYKLLIEQMTADKLIDPEKGYTISKKDDKLVVNGETLSEDVAKKYETNLKGVKDLSITGKSDNVIINVNED
jgi:protein-disulfide isomerase-like protein with CxxC motif